MFGILANREYAKLFSAQVIALLGTGLLTVALGLLAFDIAGGDAGIVMGTALAIKMVAYVAVSPVMAAAVARLPRRPVLVGADLVRAAAALALPFITEIWHVYALIFILQCASATFTPSFQAAIPEVLPDEGEYTRALSLSRLAYDLEALVSPMLAGLLLLVTGYSNLFAGTAVGFVASAALVRWTAAPLRQSADPEPFVARLTGGFRMFARDRELRGLALLNVTVSAAVAMVLVNTVVLVRGDMGGGEGGVAAMLAVYGAGSMAVALALPIVLDSIPDRPVMLAGGILAPALLGAAAVALPSGSWPVLGAIWFGLGAASSLVLTPSARILRRASAGGGRAAVFAAQFSLSHACYLATYPLAGWLGAGFGLPTAALLLGIIAAPAALGALAVWRPAARARVRA